MIDLVKFSGYNKWAKLGAAIKKLARCRQMVTKSVARPLILAADLKGSPG
jgi:hypothetical protein